MENNAWLCDVEGQRSCAKTVLGSRQKLSAAHKRHNVVPSLQCTRDRCVVQAKTALQEELLEERCLIRDNRTTANAKTVDWTIISRSGYVCG
jgi:hypothetical protein